MVKQYGKTYSTLVQQVRNYASMIKTEQTWTIKCSRAAQGYFYPVVEGVEGGSLMDGTNAYSLQLNKYFISDTLKTLVLLHFIFESNFQELSEFNWTLSAIMVGIIFSLYYRWIVIHNYTHCCGLYFKVY